MAKHKKSSQKKEFPTRLPGDPSTEQLLEQLIRVDHAGEYGAVRIYEGQLAVLKKKSCAPLISHMLEQEMVHWIIWVITESYSLKDFFRYINYGLHSSC